MPEARVAASPTLLYAKTILFAGNESVQQTVLLSLRRTGYFVSFTRCAAEALQRSREFQGPIQLLLATLELPDLTGVELARRINQERPETTVLIITPLRCGMLVLSRGWQFLPSPFESDMLRSRVRYILGETRPSGTTPRYPNVESCRKLTEREIEVLRLIAAGNSTKQIAAILGIAFKTSVGHRTRLMKKLTVHDPVSLVRNAIREGLIDPMNWFR